MILDASAIVAILGREPEAAELTSRLETSELRLTHPVSLYEAVLAVRRINDVPTAIASADVWDFLRRAGSTLLRLDGAEATAALEAFARYGKGSGHPARLNMGDCFSYACAKVRGLPLLYTGEDFAHTDLA